MHDSLEFVKIQVLCKKGGISNITPLFLYIYQKRDMNSAILSRFCLPFGKADDTPSPALPRVRNSLLRLHPWAP
jgi:hypothetical protein